MGKATKARANAAPQPPMATGADATPERLAKGDMTEWQETKKPGQSAKVIRERRFITSHLDRLYKNKRLTYRQFFAGDWYREQHHRCRYAASCIAAYGDRTRAGEHPGSFGYGLPTAEVAVRAREIFGQARASIPKATVGFVDRFVLHDELPRYGGRQQMRSIRELAGALDALADWLSVPANHD